jgi:hypothetical protein
VRTALVERSDEGGRGGVAVGGVDELGDLGPVGYAVRQGECEPPVGADIAGYDEPRVGQQGLALGGLGEDDHRASERLRGVAALDDRAVLAKTLTVKKFGRPCEIFSRAPGSARAISRTRCR